MIVWDVQDETNLANFVISDRLASEEIAFAYKTRWSTEIVEQLESSCPRFDELGRAICGLPRAPDRTSRHRWPP